MLYTRKGDTGTTKTFGCDLPAPRPGTFFVYAILCADDSIYIGQTNDLPKRWHEHVNYSGAEYFKTHKPVKLVHYEEYPNRAEAVERERNLKTGFGRKWLKRELKAGRTRQAGQRISKSSLVAEALGSLDETNSFLGLCKVKAEDSRFKIQDSSFAEIVHQIQQNLFIVQAELAGAPARHALAVEAGGPKTISQDKVLAVEKLVDLAEKEMPPIKSFFISGGTELAAFFDVARTISRRAERRVVGAVNEGNVKLSKETMAYLNRLSSLLYALARLSNHKSGVKEEAPQYK